MANVPPDHALRVARAHKRMKERMDHLSDIGAQFLRRFQAATPLDHFEILPQIDVNFRAYIFLRKDSDITAGEANGTNNEMRDFVYDKLEEFGRGKRDEITVSFEFDSFENVQRNFEGSYFLRMR
jgi:hypothetical protein